MQFSQKIQRIVDLKQVLKRVHEWPKTSFVSSSFCSSLLSWARIDTGCIGNIRRSGSRRIVLYRFPIVADFCHLLSGFIPQSQSFMTISHHINVRMQKVNEVDQLKVSLDGNVCEIIQECHWKSYHCNIKCPVMTLNIIHIIQLLLWWTTILSWYDNFGESSFSSSHIFFSPQFNLLSKIMLPRKPNLRLLFYVTAVTFLVTLSISRFANTIIQTYFQFIQMPGIETSLE